MKYRYIASEINGKVAEGEIEAEGPAEVLEMLSEKGLRPISVKPAKSLSFASRSLFRGSVNTSDKVFLTKYLALMLKVGTDLLKAINILIDDFDKPAVKDILLEVRKTLEKGQPFYSTFAKHKNSFSPVFVSLIRAGETSGNLEKVFEDLSISLEKEQVLKNKIRSAMVYPLLLLGMSVVMVVFLVTFALPKISGMFQTGSFEPPLFSKIVFSIGGFLGNYMFIFFPLFAFLAGGGIYFFMKTGVGRRIFFRVVSYIPVVSGVLKKIALQRFATTLSSLMRSGLPILDAIEITAEAVGNEEIKASLMRISREGISKGLTLGDAFKRERDFPKVVSNLVAVSEKAGHVEDVLDTLANFYETEIDVSVKALVSFVEPMMLLFLGLIIGGIALAVIIPVYQLVGQF
ncbi:MAG: type II secretion system F family protein [Candidatus Paceibacterota bacterium]